MKTHITSDGNTVIISFAPENVFEKAIIESISLAKETSHIAFATRDVANSANGEDVNDKILKLTITNTKK